MGWKTENYTGADCTGSNGDANRVLTLSNTSLTIDDGLLVYASGLALAVTSEYTITHSATSSTITFVNRLWDDMTIIVKYFQIIPEGGIPLNARFIQKNIQAVGNTCTIIEVSRSYGTDEYRTKTESTSDTNSVKCFVQVLSHEDESVKQGEARAGDLTFWFDSSRSAIIVQGNRITWNSDTYQITNVKQFRAKGNTLYLIECDTEQI